MSPVVSEPVRVSEQALSGAYHRDLSLPELFARVARAYADKPALIADDGSLTYAELLARSRLIANHLRALGFGPGDTIGILAHRRLDTIAQLLGVLSAGAAYLPLDLGSTPHMVLARQAETAGLAAILCDPAEAPDGLRSLAIASAWESLSSRYSAGGERDDTAATEAAIDVAIEAGSPAYILFTSGSTGEPKGVVVPHRAIARLVLGQQYLPFGADQRYLLHSPLSFDASTLEVWAPLLHGATLILAPDRTLALEDFPALIARHRITTLWLTAAVFHLLARHTPEALDGLDHLVVGGDVVSPQAVAQAYSACPRLSITNGYGPTESTTFALTYRVPRDLSTETPLPIGRPLAHTTAYILDANLEPVPDGREGQLALGGDGVALGYVHAPALTAERFVDDLFSPLDGARLYLTGDRVSRDDQGLIHFRGRLDQEIKIAGHRVSPHEIEAALGSLPGVQHAVAIARGQSPETRQLHAVIEPASGVALTDRALRATLSTLLPRYAVPAVLLVVARIPVNANGKLDRAAAAALLNGEAAATPAAEPVTLLPAAPGARPALDAVLAIWKTVLETDDVAPETNFFDAGGDSLLLIQVHFQLNQLRRGSVDLMALFSATTPRKMAALLA